MVRLEARDITVDFGRRSDSFRAVDAVDLSVASGECLGIVGESGSGKTTLARVIIGMLAPTRGSVLLDDEIVNAPDGTRYRGSSRRRVQVVFQDPYDALNPRMTALGTVAEALRVTRGRGRHEAAREAVALLADVGITAAQTDYRPARLSGGQRQRVAIARALAAGPDVLVADEPTSAIDQSAQAHVLNTLRQLRDDGLAMVFVSHDLGVVGYIATHVLVMRQGRVVEHGPTMDVLGSPAHEYTRRLLESTPGRARRRGQGSRAGS